jgi:hypothetical protein
MSGAGDNRSIDDWVIDSGASRSMTPHLKKLSNVVELDRPIKITFANGDTGYVVAEGDAYVLGGHPDSTRVRLTKVLYVPEASTNLISVSYGTNRGASFNFADDRCTITNPADLKTSVTSWKTKKLSPITYHLSTN